jgi:chromosome segregation ATPase
LENSLKEITVERDRLSSALEKEKGNVVRLTAEIASMASIAKASSEDERVQAFAERQALFEKERAKLLQDLEEAIQERDGLSAKLAASPRTIPATVAPSLTASATGDEGDLDSAIARSIVNELELAREILTKENEDLRDEKARLAGRLEELETMNSNLKEQLNEAASHPAQKKSFFSRASVMMSPPTLSAPSSSTLVDGQTSLPTRSEILATKYAELDGQMKDLTKQKEELVERIMNLTNDNNNKDIEMRKMKRQIADVNEKIEAMSLLAEQTSAIKIKLARRLDTLVQENTTLKQSLSEKEDQLAAMTDVSRVLNDELMNKSLLSPQSERII